MKYILLFDFGHGTRQYTVGKHSPFYKTVNGNKEYTLYEGEWNREVGGMIVDTMRKLGVDCRVIVPEDQDIPLMERVSRANQIVRDNPDAQCIYVSIHINAAANDNKSHSASGWSVWVSGNASSKSKELAKTLYDVADEFGLKGNRSVPKERCWTANFTVITKTSCPAVLTENLFMDNEEECKYLCSKEGKEKLVNLHVVGLCKYMGIPATIKYDI